VPLKETLLTEGVTPEVLFIANCIEPLPEPVLTVMVHEVPEPDTLAIAAPLTPLVLKVKSAVDKPLTDAANVAVHCIELALVVVLLTAVSELMVVLAALSVPDTAWVTVVAPPPLTDMLPDIVPTEPVPASRT
jgi:hypothetical protein